MLESDSRLPYHRWRDFLEKDRLVQELAAWRARHADSAAFWPESFALPADQEAFERFRAISPPGQIFIVKPPAGSGGKGIVVTRDPRPASRPAVVQRYLDRPYLVDGRKCHVRLHLLITTHGSPRAYLQRDGIVRIAPEPYATDDAALRRAAAQVTNTGLHRFHRDMRIAPSDADSMGNVWRLSALLRRQAEDGLDAGQIHLGMIDLARRLVGIIVESGLFRAQAEEHSRYCFPPLVIGLDLLLDEAGRSWLLECQRSPSLIGGALVDGIVGALGAGAFPLALDDGSGDVAAACFDRLL
jgi:tubulin polyglutamylase TTLL4